MELSDEALVLACRQGDDSAWVTLIDRYQRLVYSIPRKAGLPDELSADVFQQTFALLVEHLHRLDQPARVAAWLVTTAKRETWRVGRGVSAARANTGGSVDDASDYLPDDAPLPEETLLRLEQQHLIRAALAELDERCRRLLTLLFMRREPPAYADIAAELGLPAGSIGPTRARCLEKLRRLLSKFEQ